MDPGVPALLGSAHEHFDRHIAIDPYLARQAKLAQHPVFLEAVVLLLSHLRLALAESDAAGRATGLAAAPVAHVDAVLLEREDELLAVFHVEAAKTLDRQSMVGHAHYLRRGCFIVGATAVAWQVQPTR